ncbi:MAG TPA: phospholipase D-like domain-containing protein [Candidatus Paceibacterota bacterium]
MNNQNQPETLTPTRQDTISDQPLTTWHITYSTVDAWKMMLKAIESAQESIYMEQFLLEPDETGQEFLRLFIKKAKEGVTVKLIFDSMYSKNLARSPLIEELRRAGAKVKFFNWLLPFSKHNKKILFFRNHRRLLLIDRETMITGGICIRKKMEPWRETCIRIQGNVVNQAIYVFDKTWKKVYRQHSMRLGTQTKTGPDGFSYITHAPLIKERHVYYRMIDAIRHARKTIYITTPYFLPDRRLQRVLILAKKRGVDVRLLVPKNSNHPIVDIGSHTYFHKMLVKGIKIFQYETMIHAKTATIDGEWAMLGTMNLDNISLRYNFESSLIITNRTCVAELEEQYAKDLRLSKELTLDAWNNRPLLQRFKELLVWPVRKVL